jgi:hypothetical protein
VGRRRPDVSAHLTVTDPVVSAGDYLFGVERQLPLIDRRPALVTITMGGNDLLATHGDSVAARSVIGRVPATGEAVLCDRQAQHRPGLRHRDERFAVLNRRTAPRHHHVSARRSS